jgi:DNA-binding CsgD family transcriptional regulator
MKAVNRGSGSIPVADGLVDLLADLAGLGTPAEASEALPELLGRMSLHTGAAACQLDASTTTSQEQRADTRFQTVATIGYPDAAARHLAGKFTESHHGRLVMMMTGGLRIARDPYGFRSSSDFREVLQPAGFDDGVSLALRNSAQDVVGALHLSAVSVRDFRPNVLATVEILGRALARAIQLASCSTPDVTLPRDFAAVRLDARGVATPMVGREPLHLELDADVRAIIGTVLATGTQFGTFLHQQRRRLIEVRLYADGTATSSRRACIVGTRPARSTCGLTLRQLEVLTAVATGAGNREIAQELCLTPRTIAAHVEAILTRLGTPTRAGAAAMATAAGILLPSPVPGSVRSMAAILRTPSA